MPRYATRYRCTACSFETFVPDEGEDHACEGNDGTRTLRQQVKYDVVYLPVMGEEEVRRLILSTPTCVESSSFGGVYAETYGMAAHKHLFAMDPIERARHLFNRTLSVDSGKWAFWNWVRCGEVVLVYREVYTNKIGYEVVRMPATEETFRELAYRLFTLFMQSFTNPIAGSEGYNTKEFQRAYWYRTLPLGIPMCVCGEDVTGYRYWMADLKQLIKDKLPKASDFGRTDLVMTVGDDTQSLLVWACTSCGKSFASKTECASHTGSCPRRDKPKMVRTEEKMVGRRVPYTLVEDTSSKTSTITCHK